MTLGTNVPTPAYTNVPITPQFWIPSYFEVVNIQLGEQTQVTIAPNFGRSLDYVVGNQVLFEIPNAYGTSELNGRTGVITEIIDDLNFKVNIDSVSGFTPFIQNPKGARQIAQVVPAGTYRTGNINPNTTDVGLTIPGSFTNTQPFVGTP